MKKHFLTIVFLIFYQLNFSQEYSSIKNIDSFDGLPTDVVYNITQDKEGYIWLSTDCGVIKYNGSSYKVFSTKDGLPSNDILKTLVDSKNRKWVSGYFSGLYYIENDVVKKVIGSESAENLILTFEKDGNNYFKNFNTQESYFINKKKKFVSIYYNNTNNSIINYNEKLKSYLAFNRKTLENIIITRNKITNVPENFIFYDKADNNIFTFYKPAKIAHFINSPKNLDVETLEWDGQTFKTLEQNDVHYLNCSFDKKYIIIYRKTNFIEVYKDSKIESTLTNEINKLNLNIRNINKIFIDEENNFWILHNNSTLQFIPKNFSISTFYPVEKDKPVKKSYFLNGLIFFATSDNKLYKYHLKQKKLILIKDYGNRFIRDIVKKNNKLLIVLNDGLEYFNITPNSIAFSNYSYFVNRELFIKNNNEFSVNKSKVFCNNEEVFMLENTIRFNTLFVDDYDNIYTSNENLILRINYKSKDTITNNTIKNTSCVKGINDQLVVGTIDNGLYLVNSNLKIIDHFDVTENIYSIQISKNSKLILASNKGIRVLEIINNKIVLLNKIDGKEYFIKGKINTLQLIDDIIFVSTSHGFYIIDYKKKEINNWFWTPKIEVDYIQSKKKKTSDVFNKIVFERNNNNLTFSTSIFNFGDNINFEKKYKLIKDAVNHNEWQKFEYKNLNFNNLENGNYTLELCLSSRNGEIFDTKKINFEIQPHIWETFAFKITTSFFFILILTLIFVYYRKKITRKEKNKLKLVNLELKALKSQMSPHFIFNTLNNYQSIYVLEGENEANIFLRKFSELIRKTLEIVNQENISLDEEIVYLKNYVELESIKNNLQIELEIKITDTINTKTIEIPVMILQPIIENSIKHGFKNDRNNKIIINIEQIDNKTIVIAIIDNGVGRIVTLNSNSDHKSMATGIINERLKIINSLGKKLYFLTLEDLFDDKVNIGTKSTLTIIEKK
jgi:two-component sensor histidine kinase